MVLAAMSRLSRGLFSEIALIAVLSCSLPAFCIGRLPLDAGGRNQEYAQSPTTSFCETCGRPMLLGSKTCFHCLKNQASDGAVDWARWAADRSRQALESLKDPNLTDNIVEKLLEVKQDWQNRHGGNPDVANESRRQSLEMLGNRPIGSEGKSVNDMAREAVRQYLPALEGTDFAADPVRTLSYYLVLDGKGFARDVHFLSGPMGQPMTLLEAAEYYRGIDPARSSEILELLDDIRKLSSPDCKQDQVPALLDSIARGIKLLTK